MIPECYGCGLYGAHLFISGGGVMGKQRERERERWEKRERERWGEREKGRDGGKKEKGRYGEKGEKGKDAGEKIRKLNDENEKGDGSVKLSERKGGENDGKKEKTLNNGRRKSKRNKNRKNVYDR